LRLKSQQTVLVVEDVEWIRRGMKRNLQLLGYRVVEAADAAAAVESALACPPDVIVTEEELPTLDALTESVRGPGPLHGVPVAIINPDEEEGARRGDIIILPDFGRIETLMDGARRRSPRH
jgi:CheY-like chemotaxis protein